MDAIDRVPGLASSAGHVRQLMMDKRISCRAYTREQGQDAPEINNWKWHPVGFQNSAIVPDLASMRPARTR